MYQILLITIALVAFIVLANRLLGNRGHKKAARKAREARLQRQALARKHPWRAVSCEGSGCSVVQELRGKRFLEREAPSLPLPGCGAAHCNCRYVHYDDRRRHQTDRRSLYGVKAELFEVSGQEERRQRHGRRSTDLAWG